MSAEVAARLAVGPNTFARMRRRNRQRRALLTTIVLLLLAATFVLVTGQTGFPGPGPMRRYPTHELQEVADRLNHLDCATQELWPAPGASVDWVRSRVHLEHPERIVASPDDRARLENPLPEQGVMVPTFSIGACYSSTPVG
jgi:hypothetical protein